MRLEADSNQVMPAVARSPALGRIRDFILRGQVRSPIAPHAVHLNTSLSPIFRHPTGPEKALRARNRLPVVTGSALPIVVFLVKDVPALLVLAVLDAALLSGTHMAIRSCTCFGLGDTRLPAF